MEPVEQHGEQVADGVQVLPWIDGAGLVEKNMVSPIPVSAGYTGLAAFFSI